MEAFEELQLAVCAFKYGQLDAIEVLMQNWINAQSDLQEMQRFQAEHGEE